MKVNLGGNLAPQNVIGRDALIDQIWERLETQSVLLNAERRIGKTQVLKKMAAEPREGWQPIYRDLESIHTADEFAADVYDTVQKFLNKTQRARNFVQKLFEENEVKGISLKGRTWKQLLTAAIKDLMQAEADRRLVFFWDEVPYMIESIRTGDKENGNRVAAEVLDTLRSLRVEHEKFRVVYTGSLGMHHVVSKLTAERIPTSPVNDMCPVKVTPLAPKHATDLAIELLVGEGFSETDVRTPAEAIAEQVDYFPFYIHHVVAGLKNEQLEPTEENITRYVSSQLTEATDPWQLGHYQKRLKTYYPAGNDDKLVATVLDILATIDHDASLSVNEIIEATLSRDGGPTFEDCEHALRLLKLMDADHYVTRDGDGKYSFLFPLVRRWWKLDRGL